jgi:multiple sugar transport system substrate-binding protein
VASGPTTTVAPAGSVSGTITWEASPITSSSPDPRTVLISAFEKANPKVHVKLISAPSDTDTYRANLITQIAGGGGPDVYMGDVIWPAQFAAHQYATPISNFLGSSYFKGFAPGLIAGATYQGKVIGAPFFEDQGFLYYRKDLLKKDGLSVPKTWAQLAADSKIIQGKKQTQYGFVFQGSDYEGATCDFMEYLADADNSNVDTVLNGASSKSTLTANANAVKALTQEVDFVKEGISPKAESSYEEAQAMTAFQDGDSAFLRNWDYAYSTSQTSPSKVIGKVGVAPLPTFSAADYPGYSNIGGWNLYINPHSKDTAADVAFIKFLTGTQGQTILASQFSEIPTNEAVRTSPKVVASNAVLAVVPHTKLVPRPAQTPDYAAVSQSLYQNISAALAGTKSPSAAISSASSGINSALSGNSL